MKINKLLMQLWQHFNKREKSQFFLLLCLQLLNAGAEMLSIGLSIPFLTAINDSQSPKVQSYVKIIIEILHLKEDFPVLPAVTAVFIAALVISAAIRYITLWFSTKLSFQVGLDIGNRIYRNILYRPYDFHIKNNSSTLINSVIINSDKTLTIINAFFGMIGSGIIMFGIIALLLWLNPFVTFISFLIFSTAYILVAIKVKKRLLINSEIINKNGRFSIQNLQEGLGGIRDVLMDGAQEIYCNAFKKTETLRRSALANNIILGNSPRLFLEPIGMILIGLIAFYLAAFDGQNTSIFPIIGAIAIAAQRVIPMLQQGYLSWTVILSSRSALIETIDVLNYSESEVKDVSFMRNIPFKQYIELRNVSFKYAPELEWILKDLNWTISKNACVGIIGGTGCGKSTLMDILMSLLKPSKGALLIDGLLVDEQNRRSWTQKIAHVPQNIYLSEATILENVAFGIPKAEIDINRAYQALDMANILGEVELWPIGVKTIVGERGVRLSGGQRQRIGIARAFYKGAEVLILDEATSALDDSTESEIMKTLEKISNKITIFIIAHRISTLKKCSEIVEIKQGNISWRGNYLELCNMKGMRC